MSGSILQSGPVTPGHVVMWIGNGIVRDAGPSDGGLLTHVGITNGTDEAFGINSGPITAPYTHFGIQVSPNGQIQFVFEGVDGGAAAQLSYVINGATYTFPGVGTGDVTGPSSSIDGNLAVFDGTTGKRIRDGGAPLIGPSSSVDGDIAVFSGTSGHILRDSGVKPQAVIQTIAALRLVDTVLAAVLVEGYYAPGDQGGGNFVYVPTDTTSADNGGTIIVDAAGHRYYRQIDGDVNVRQFGARGDGSADDTGPITAADAYCRSLGCELYFPGATYLVSQLVVYTGSNWRGDGRDATTILQRTGSNIDLIYGNNSNANWGSSNPTLIVNGWTMKGMTLNGNWNAGAGNTSGSGMAVYGRRPILEDVFITNVAEHGMRTEYTDGAADGDDTFTMEGFLQDIRIDTTGKHGWWNNGPHDTVTIGMIVVDAGQQATNTFDAFYYDAKSTGRNVAIHAWSRQASNRMRYALSLQPGAQHEFSGGCNFEGAYSAVVAIFSQKNIFDDSTRVYAAWNGVTIYMGLNATLNILRGYIDGPGAGRPASVGIVMGSVAGDFIANNTIDMFCSFQEEGAILFTSFDGGSNKIRMHCYNQTSATYFGNPAPTDDIDIQFDNSSGSVKHLSNRLQSGTVSLPGSGSVTWTYPFPYAAAPIVTYSIEGPAGDASGGTWITARSATSVTIFNNTSFAMTLNITAMPNWAFD